MKIYWQTVIRYQTNNCSFQKTLGFLVRPSLNPFCWPTQIKHGHATFSEKIGGSRETKTSISKMHQSMDDLYKISCSDSNSQSCWMNHQSKYTSDIKIYGTKYSHTRHINLTYSQLDPFTGSIISMLPCIHKSHISSSEAGICGWIVLFIELPWYITHVINMIYLLLRMYSICGKIISVPSKRGLPCRMINYGRSNSDAHCIKQKGHKFSFC